MPTAATLLTQPSFSTKLVQPIMASANAAILNGYTSMKAVIPIVATAPVTADKLDVPIALRSPPSEMDVFHAPSGRGRSYVPRYNLRETHGPQGARYEMAFVQDESGRWGLQIDLDLTPPSGNGAGQTAVIHEPSLSLSFHPAGDSARSRKSLPFQEVIDHEGGKRATLWLSSLPERDEVYHALTSPTYRAALAIKRRTCLAVEQRNELAQSVQENMLAVNNMFLKKTDLAKSMIRADLSKFKIKSPKTELSPPKVELVGIDHGKSGHKRYVEYYLSVQNWQTYDKDLFEVIEFKDGGRLRKGARLQIQLLDAQTGKPVQDFSKLSHPEELSKLRYAVSEKSRPPEHVLLLVTDRKTSAGTKSNLVELERPKTPQKTYTQHWFDFETTLSPDPFLFDPNLHAHIFQALSGPPPQPSAGGLIRHREEFNGIVHSYFQDDVAQNRIYFLPDEFRITRHSGPFRPPMVTVRVQSSGEDTSSSEVTFDYVMAPHINRERLMAAATQIAANTGQASEDLIFQPYLSSDLSFTLTRPTAGGRAVEARPTSPLMLQEPVIDTLVMDVTDFQIMFDAMIGNTASVLSGEIAIEVDGWGTEIRRFVADFAQLEGDVLDLTAQMKTDSKSLLTLSNAIESTVALNGPRVAAVRGEASLEVAGLSHLVEDLHPTDPVALSVTYNELSGSGPVEMALLKAGTVVPDPEAIMDAILDRSSLEYFRHVEVHSLPSFYTPSNGPEIAAILVDFEGGETVRLTPDSPSATTRIDYSFSKVILRQLSDDGSFTYRKTIIYADGQQAADTVPSTGTGSLFYVLTTPTLG